MMFVVLFLSRIFLSYRDVIIASTVQILILFSTPTVIERGGIFSVPHLLWQRPLWFCGLIRNTIPFVQLLRQGKCIENYSNPETHGKLKKIMKIYRMINFYLNYTDNLETHWFQTLHWKIWNLRNIYHNRSQLLCSLFSHCSIQ